MPFFGVPIRNGLPIGLGSVAGFGVQQFDPSQLFAGGTVAGAWYDPSDLSTMFTTSAGTTPVAMPGLGSAVSVGLMLDKSQGLVLGSDVVVNGDFASGASWITQAGWAISGGSANGAATNAYLYQTNASIVVNGFYEITFTVSNYSAGTVQPYLGATVTLGTTVSGNGTFTQRLSPIVNGNELGFKGNGFTGSIDNVSIKQVSGNHAIAFNNTTARPELRARVNLLTYSEDFSNAAWLTFGGASKISANAIRLTSADTASNVYQQFTAAETNASSYVFSVEVKRNAATNQTFQLFQNIRGVTPFGRSGNLVATDEWQRFTLTHTSAGGSGVSIFGVIGNTAGTQADLLVRNADLRPANIGANVPAYQRIADANTYDTSGFPLYLRFDGIDDSMYTPANLNLSGTDKVAVFAGVRKLSDAADGVIAELSNNFNSAIGGFLVNYTATGVKTAAALKGNVGYSSAEFTDSAAPVSEVLSTLMDMGLSTNELSFINKNGVAQILTRTNNSNNTGNYGTYPLYIGSRANSSLWLNGQLYGLIIAGSAVSAGNISATEQWVANKTGIVIP